MLEQMKGTNLLAGKAKTRKGWYVMRRANEQQEQMTFFDAPAPGEYEIPEGAARETCRSCNASITWGRTPNGNSIPLDLSHVRIIAGRRYAMTHFTTCPHSHQWRRRNQAI